MTMNSLVDPLRRRPLTSLLCIFSLFSLGFMTSTYRDQRAAQLSKNKQPSDHNMHKQRTHTHIRSNNNDNNNNNNGDGVRRIALLGERNSGTNWMTEELTKCYPQVEVTPDLTRWKHWFQEDDSIRGVQHNNTLVIAEFRNVYDWLESMRLRPHNMPMHMNQDWYTFVTTAWTMPRPERDLNMSNKTGSVCQSDFEYHQVISCVKGTVPSKRHHSNSNWPPKSRQLRSEYEPIYEMRNDGSGLAYGSIIEMRADKIRNHLSVADWDWVTAFTSVQYEKLLVEGTEFLLREIEELTGLKAQCDPVPPQPERLSHYPKGPGFEEWVGEHVDWSAEHLIGYSKW
mmetsp:Transcript_27838/g.43201  ORF Transcript_27838/g.43201 Transcript_27838/m.43201 type:complete len:341 (-) Transcript_27838:191-1213(-)